MADGDKKPTSYVTWFIIGGIVLLIILGVIFYMMYRKSSSNEIKVAENDKSIQDMKMEINTLKAEVGKRDDKIHEQSERISNLEKSITELKFQLKLNNQSSSNTQQVGRRQKAKQKDGMVCDENGCTMPAKQETVVEDMDD